VPQVLVHGRRRRASAGGAVGHGVQRWMLQQRNPKAAACLIHGRDDWSSGVDHLKYSSLTDVAMIILDTTRGEVCSSCLLSVSS
jgi:hypothetical protein